MYKVNWKAYGGYDGYYSYTEEKYVKNISELMGLLSDICDEEDIIIETLYE